MLESWWFRFEGRRWRSERFSTWHCQHLAQCAQWVDTTFIFILHFVYLYYQWNTFTW